QMAVVFDNLPDGVTLENASGSEVDGDPYVNFRGAIRPGGLAARAISDAVQVVFSNPGLLQLDLETVVLAGGANQAPIFEAPIVLPNLMPGAVLKLPLNAVDPDGDVVTYTLRTDGDLPTGQLRGNGVLEFRPRPDQVGEYTFTVVATDGALEATQEVTLKVVADPVTTTRISGVIENVAQEALVGVVIEIGGVQTVTDANGGFTLEFIGDLPSDTLRVHGEGILGDDVYPFIAEKLPLVLGHAVFGGVNNVIDRPIYLPVLDVASGQTIDPTQDVMVTTPNIPGAAVTVKAGSLMNQQGSSFTGVLSITKVPTELTPAALPPGMNPELVVTIQPGDMVFTTPAALSLPNESGFAPGTLMDLWSINPTTGDFDKVGVGQVSADGSVIETIEGGIRNSSWHFFGPVTRALNSSTEDNGCKNCKATKGLSSEVELNTGAVIETHELVSYTSLGARRGLTLTYDSLRADSRPIIDFGFDTVDTNAIAPGFADRLRLKAELAISRGVFQFEVPGYAGGQYGLDGGEHFWSIPTGVGPVRAALQADIQELGTGRYDYSLSSGIFLFVRDQFVGTASTNTGEFIHVNTRDSGFGSGWGISGLTEIVENPDGSILLVDGDGSELIFEVPTQVGGAYTSPPGEFSSLTRLADGRFQRTFKDQTVELYDENNLLSLVRDTNGNETQYQYNADLQISEMIDPVGLVTEFRYVDGRVSQIIDPTGRVTQLVHDEAGNLTHVIDPDESVRNWEYDAEHHMTAEVDQRGNREQAFYDFAGRATGAIGKDGSVIQVAPTQVQGLSRPEETSNPLSSPLVSSTDESDAIYVDGNGNVSKTQLDLAGQTVTSRDGSGNGGSVLRNEQNLVTNSKDSRGYNDFYTYDDQGNILTVREELSTLTGGVNSRGSFLEFDGINDYVTGELLSTVQDDFTIAFWVNPTAERNLTAENNIGIAGIGGQRYAIAPIQGEVAVGSGYAGVGVSVGTNGLSVFEHSGFYLPSPLVYEGDLSGWTHIAIVYDDKTPSLFINGEFVKTGLKSNYKVLPGTALGDIAGYGPFEGQLDDFRIWKTARSETEVQLDASRIPLTFEPDLVGAWDFNEGGGETIVDLTFNNRNGSLVNGVSWENDNSQFFPEASGQAASSLYFDGSNDYVKLEDRSIIANFPNSTFEGWIRSENQDGTRVIYSEDSPGGTIYQINQTGNTVGFSIWRSDVSENWKSIYADLTQNSVAENEWFHVAAVLDESSGMQLYINGELASSYSQDTRASNASITSANLGYATNSGGSAYFQGQIDEIRTWDKALKIGDIQASFRRLLLKNDENLVGYWRLDEGSEANVSDLTGRNSNGILFNGTRWSSDSALLQGYESNLGVKSGIREFTYNQTFNQLTSATDELGRQTLNEIDATTGNILSTTQVVGEIGGDDDLITRYLYTAQGLVDSMTDPLGRVTNYDYDSQGRLVQITSAQGTADEALVQFEYDAAGNQSAVIDENGNRTKFEYDVLNRLIRVTEADPDGAGPLDAPMTRYTYDRRGNQLTATDAREHTTQFEYDAKDRVIVTTDALNGRMTYEYDAAGNIVETNDELGQTTLYAYDSRNRRTQIIDPDGNITRFRFDADNNLIAVVDALGNPTSYAYDARDRLIAQTNALGGARTYNYDVANNLVASSDENGHTSQFAYDDLDRLLTTTDALGGVSTLTYDKAGNVTASTDELGRITTFGYDNRDRLISETDSLGEVMTYAYDDASNLISTTDEIGRTTTYGYDALNRRISTTDPLGHVTTYTFDGVDNLVAYQDELGRTTAYTYDALDRQVRVTNPLGDTFTTVFDAADNVIAISDELGRTSTFAYDKRDLRTSVTDPLGHTTTTAYDGVGNVTAVIDPLGHQTTYGYDALYRRTSTTDAIGERTNFSFDAEGNLLRITDPENNTTTYAYDALDRMVSNTNELGFTRRYQYDAVDNQIGMVDRNGRVMSYVYDGLDRRTQE
ncbi:MAG: LamG-like jellyroll fold domain-containing protein, partial [Thermosynechococcaceae cyanobacterium]